MIDFELTDEQKLIRETAREFSDKEIARAPARTTATSTSTPSSCRRWPTWASSARSCPRSTGPRRGLLDLRADRRGDRAQRLRDAHRDVGGHVARLLVARPLGHRGAEEALAAGAVLGRGARLLRAHRARHRLRRANLKTRAEKIDGGWRINGKMWISLGNYQARADLRPDGSRRRTRAWPASSCRPTATASRPRRSTASSGSRDRTPRSSRSTAWRSATTRCWARSATASRSRCPRSTPAATASPPAAWGSARRRWTRRWPTRRSAPSSTGRSPPSSSCRR